jgi:uncharacterized protein
MIAYSGGVDSAFLAAVSAQVLGDKALAVTAVSPTFTEEELKDATALARQFNIRHRVIETQQMDKESFVRNDSRRCFYCKTELYTDLEKIASEENCAWILNGTNTDDLGDYRPGLDAARQHNVRSPLVEANLSKKEIRELSKEMGLPTWDKPANPCLSSRIPYGIPVTLGGLSSIARGEAYLRALGIRYLRVRHHNDIARIEVDEAGMLKLMQPETRKQTYDFFKGIGYAYVTLDLGGFRSGSLNDALPVGTKNPV